MKDLIKNILREETDKSNKFERVYNSVVNYINRITFPKYVCNALVVKLQESQSIMIILMYDRVVSDDLERNLNKEINKIFRMTRIDIWVTGNNYKIGMCDERMSEWKKNENVVVIPNKNYSL